MTAAAGCLDGDVAAESRIARTVDFAHPVGADERLHVIDAELTADQRQGSAPVTLALIRRLCDVADVHDVIFAVELHRHCVRVADGQLETQWPLFLLGGADYADTFVKMCEQKFAALQIKIQFAVGVVEYAKRYASLCACRPAFVMGLTGGRMRVHQVARRIHDAPFKSRLTGAPGRLG
jgi:hypothetical protein